MRRFGSALRCITGLLLCLTSTLVVSAGEPIAVLNSSDLAGWEGDSRFWRMDNGVLIGETTTENPTPKNTFLVYTAKEFADFQLSFQYQVHGNNSGIQYRSEILSKWVVKGLQADFEDRMHKGLDKFSGMFFEENGRMFMGQRGEVVLVKTNAEQPKKPVIEKLGSVGDPLELEKLINREGWNSYMVVAKGNVFIHIINGRVMCVAIDEDQPHARAKGFLAFQLHSGAPLKIQIKDMSIRELD